MGATPANAPPAASSSVYLGSYKWPPDSAESALLQPIPGWRVVSVQEASKNSTVEEVEIDHHYYVERVHACNSVILTVRHIMSYMHLTDFSYRLGVASAKNE